MNKYWIIALLVAFAVVGGLGERYGEYRVTVKCDTEEKDQQQVTIAGQQHVITEVAKQQTITTGVSNAYHTGISTIDNLYSTASMQQLPAASGNLSAVPSSAGRTDGPACKPSPTRYYRLTPKECDDNTAQLIGLQTWVKNQSVVK